MQSTTHEIALEPSIIEQGLELMIFGMGTVFVFLAVLVVVTSAMSAIVNRFFPDQTPAAKPQAPSIPPPGAVQPSENATLMAVISAAGHQYRSRHK